MKEFHLFEEKQEQSLLAAFGWWEKRRLLYNLFTGGTGVLCLLLLSLFPLLEFIDYLGILLYGIIVNVFYSLGFLIEVAARYYFKSQADFLQKRKMLFGLGLVISILVTAALVFAYGFMLSSPFQH